MRLVFLGPPGAGKGTQAARLCRARGLLHLSTGDLLRAAVEAGTPLGRKARGYMDRGALVPDDVVLALLGERLEAPDAAAGFVLDGYPRNVEQARALEQVLGPDAVEGVVHFQLGHDEILRRLLGRGRGDDSEAVIRHRIEVYHTQTEPLVAHYRDRGLLRTVDALGTVDEVHGRLLEAVEATEAKS